MAISSRHNIEAARATFASSRSTLIDRQYEFEQASDALEEAKRSMTGEDLAPFESALAAASTELDAALAQHDDAFVSLQDALGEWLATDAGAAEDSVEEDIQRLETETPVVLFPVRLETRFLDGKLKVRVYPDEIFLNTHEVALTVEERDAAIGYYTELNENDNERELWRDMVSRFGVERSAYILRQMLPVFGAPGPASSWWASSSTCGGTIFGGNNEDLYFPEVQLRAGSWTRPGEAVLPDRWVVVTYRGSQKRITVGSRVIEPIAMTADPGMRSEANLSELIPTTEGSYRIDDKIRWTVDFERAVEVGMGIEVELHGDEATAGFDRLIVVGVKTSMSALDTSRMLEKLLDAHHYTRGIAMVRQGSPTNNTTEETTPYPPSDDAGSISFGIERLRAPLDREHAHHCLASHLDGYRLAKTLGVPSGVMANVDRAYETEVRHSETMNQALWHGTLGYFMRHLMDAAVPGNAPVFTSEDVDMAAEYFTDYVQPRGPAPSFRVGATPYGVLPIAALSEWEHLDTETPPNAQLVEQAILGPLQRLMALWLEGVGRVPRIQPTAGNPDYDLARVLATFASAREFWIRYGYTYTFSYWQYFIHGWNSQSLFDSLLLQTRNTFDRFGLTNLQPAVGTVLWRQESYLNQTPAVAAALSETEGLAENYIQALMNAGEATSNLGAVRINEDTYTSAETPHTLFRVMLRRSALNLFAHIAESQTTTRWVELGIFGLALHPVEQIIPSVYEMDNSNLLAPYVGDFYGALQRLQSVATAELDRLFRATMDVSSRRIDAWTTAFANRRLSSLRSKQEITRLATVGDFIGGYAWLENVRPVPRSYEPVVEGSSRLVEVQPGNGGFIHAPSMTHASAAALLRNAALSSPAASDGAFAIDLSSQRVRQGRELFEGVRNGQPVGALLGYQLERGLRDAHPGATGLDAVRFALRRRYPLVANKAGDDGDELAEAIAARNVVDGQLLLADYLAALEQGTPLDLGSDPDLPSPGDPNYAILIAELDRLVDRYDAAADLLTAEAAFQLVRGNLDGAAPTLANVVEGRPPPDSIVARSARGGRTISHRVAVVFHNNHPFQLDPTWPSATARALGEPLLDAWLGEVLGAATAVSALVSYLDDTGSIIQSVGLEDAVTITLSELGLRPLDLLAVAEALIEEHQGSELDQRIVNVALNDPNRAPSAQPSKIRVDYDTATGPTFPEIIEVAHAAQSVFKASRPLHPKDLVPPAEVEEAADEEATQPVASPTAVEFYERSIAAGSALEAARAQLEAASSSTERRGALEKAAEFIPFAAYPAPTASDSELETQAATTLQELTKRVNALPPALGAPEDHSSEAFVSNGQSRFEAVFGQSFVALPAFEPPRAAELARSLAERATLLDGNEHAPDRYLQQIMRARPRVGKYRKFNLYARTLGAPRPRVDVVQLPHVPGERWLGLPFTEPPDEGRSGTLLLNYEAELDTTEPWAGLMIDDWNDVIPNAVEQTGVAMHYLSPQAQAPQAVLVAVPSRQSTAWSFAELLASLEQTMDLMKIRAVETEDVDASQVFPPLVLGTNPNITHSVTTNLSDAVVRVIREAFSG